MRDEWSIAGMDCGEYSAHSSLVKKMLMLCAESLGSPPPVGSLPALLMKHYAIYLLFILHRWNIA